MNTLSAKEVQNQPQETNLVLGNRALRSGDYHGALEAYFKVFLQYPGVFKSLAINVYYIQRQLIKQKGGLDTAPVAICTWRLFSPKTRSRALTLANLYRSSNHAVEMIDCLPPGGVHQSDSIEGIALKSLPLPGQEGLLNQILDFVMKNPYQIVHLTSAQLPNLLLGVLYKSIWNTRVLVDVDHRTVLELGDHFPIVNKFDGITVTDANLQSRYGGWVFSEPSDIAYIPSISKIKTTPAEALNSLVEMQFEAIEKILDAIKSLPSDSPLLQEQQVVNAKSDAEEQAALDRLRNELTKEIKYIEDLGYLSLDPFETANYLFTPKSHSSFLGNLFSVALGRAPKEHEANHYGGLLERGEESRLAMAQIVFGGVESKDHMTQLDRSFFAKAKFTLPQPGDLKAKDIKLPLHENPVISILIPVYCKSEYTLACLKSIADHLPKASFEILVLDDKSPDNSAKELQQVENIRVIVNPENLGFTKSCNYGATFARGEYIYFLNNDTKVEEGWLDELYKTFEFFPGTGVVGSKLVYPDGSLQEAGGIVWQDGSAWNFGRNQRPDLPIFNYAREVDYVSGASLMTPAKVFKELGGFNEIYAPAYCEDADYALHARSKGFRVIYQPMSTVTHFEGVSSGTDTASGVKAYQVRNLKLMYERWKDLLVTHSPNGVNVDDEKDRRANKRVLVMEPTLLTPDKDAGSVTTFNILMLLREMDFQVTFIPEDNLLYQEKYAKLLQKVGVEVLYRPFMNSVESHLKEFGGRYDLAFLFRQQVVERHINAVKKYCPQAKTLYYTHDLHHLRMMREAELLNDDGKKIDAEVMKAKELKAISEVDSTILVSSAELEILRPQIPEERLEVMPLAYDVPGTMKGYEQREGIVFIGGAHHPPNTDAILFFAKEVMPLVNQSLPDVKFHVVGSNPPLEILELASENIVIHGFVEDLNEFLDQMKISVAPMRFGAGMKGKVCTALGKGVPVIATPVAAEGLGIENKKTGMIASTPEEFLSSINRIYRDKDLWLEISNKGIVLVDELCGAKISYQNLNLILDRIGIQTKLKMNNFINFYKDDYS
jgi:GT2 family glycosyltransferase